MAVPLTYSSKRDLKPARCSCIPVAWILVNALFFLLGCVVTASVILSVKLDIDSTNRDVLTPHSLGRGNNQNSSPQNSEKNRRAEETIYASDNVLQGLRILVVVVAFDFSQLPHLEEVLSSYHDVCAAGSHIDVIIHATVAYPVTLIDLYNSRINCPHFTLTIVLKPQGLRLHLVDEHRKVFYDKVDEYDLFIYTEDDIRITPTTIATYMQETQILERLVQGHGSMKPSDFNVGIVRYEYNYPANVVIDDKTRHATQNVTRVYWEHSGIERPVVGGAVLAIEQPHAGLEQRYQTMHNHHQGMFLATRQLLLAWKDRGPQCDFSNARNRPGKGPQPTEGTQRVWMSSQMLYGGRHCNVQQVLPKDKFGTLTVLHLPNKNYRRVGKYRKREFSDGTEVFEQPHSSLLTAMELHLATRRAWPLEPQIPYRGIRMVDEVNRERSPLLERRMQEYEAYVKRGGVLSEDDMIKTDLMEDA